MTQIKELHDEWKELGKELFKGTMFIEHDPNCPKQNRYNQLLGLFRPEFRSNNWIDPRTTEIGPHQFSFYLGNTRILTHNINELKEYVEEISNNIAPEHDLSGTITDFFFDVDSQYQAFHNLDKDNWDIVHK